MSSKKKARSIETLKERYGWMFIAPWALSMLLFFVYPIVHSVYISFGSVTIGENGIVTHFERLKNYREILVTDPKYLDSVFASFKDMLISLPFILVVSMVLALLLNGQFKGRIFFRGMYFLPVIFASGPVLHLFLSTASTDATQSTNFNMIDFNAVLSGLNLPTSIETYVSSALSNIFLLVWQSGIQTVLIIAGLQSIQELHYEVARVEGATRWETFWYVTFPQLIRTIILVLIFTVVELCSSNTNKIISSSFSKFNNLEYGTGSAMLWFYYLFIGLFIGVLFLVYQKIFVKKWG